MHTIHTSHTCTHYNRDRVEWDADQEKQAELAVKHNSSVFLANDKKGTRIMQWWPECCFVFVAEYEVKAGDYWDSFYMQHQNR